MEAEALVENNGRITLKLFGSQQGCPSHYRPRVQGPTGRVNSKEGLPESLRPWAVLPGAASHCGLCSLHSSTALLGCPRCNSQGLWFNTMVATPVEDTGSKIWQCPHSPPPDFTHHLCQCSECKSCGGMAVSTYIPKDALTQWELWAQDPILQEQSPGTKLLQGWGY